MKRNSTSYVTTLNVNSAYDMSTLNIIKKSISAANTYSKFKKRVVVRGRKPAEKIGGKSYDWGGNIVGGIKNATILDVYVYDRRA